MIIKEGEAIKFGYGFVRHRPEYLYGKEVAPLPINWVLRFIYWLMWRSYYPMTRAELRTLKAVQALMIEAEKKGYDRGWREGSTGAWKEVTRIYMDSDKHATKGKGE